MAKNNIQNRRKKRYFIDATKELIKKEGVEAVTVKKIAERAGFATGTLYNHFENLDVLLFNCIIDYFEILYEKLKSIPVEGNDYEKYMLQQMETFTDYFIINPEVYYLIYLKKLDAGQLNTKGKTFRPKISSLLIQSLKEYYESKNVLIDADALELIGSLISNTLHGNLLFYINKKRNLSKEGLKKKIRHEVTYILKGGEKQ